MSKKEQSESTATIGIKNIDLVLRGMEGTPLVIHSFTEKAKQEIRDKQQKKAIKVHEKRYPKKESEASKYFDKMGRECAPITAIKKAIINAATAFDSITKVGLRQAIFVSAQSGPGHLVPIENHDGTPAIGVMREDAVTIGVNTRGLTYRPEYKEWQLKINIEYNPRIVSEEQLLALVDQAGWGVGIMEGRPEKNSALGWGRFIRV
jgi:hypothetical protein